MVTSKRGSSLPKDFNKIDPRRTYMVPIDKINVPRERVTSVIPPDIEKECMESVKSKGILDDCELLLIQQQLWLTDGLHRIEWAEKLGMTSVPAKIKKGSLEDLIIENIIRARQRGKSNPAQEAEVLDLLCRKRGFPLANAAKQMGMSLGWAKKLLKLAPLPEEIKDLLKHNKIPITGAFYIADLPKATDQLKVARDAQFYNYSAPQIKVRVWQLLNPDREPAEGSYKFNEGGKPQKIPLTCHFCPNEIAGKDSYIWICGDCLHWVREFMKSFRRQTAAAQPPTPPSETPPLTPVQPHEAIELGQKKNRDGDPTVEQ